MRQESQKHPGTRVVSLFLATMLCSTAAGAPTRPICGRLSEHDGLSVLDLWGTPAEAGYAHGYLLAERIVPLFDGYVLDPHL
ncbi:MAG: hypothetical protein JXO22_04135, partial [Phycisphaerae bacterium]|nr:hypothetical protein [Phycisphaerae bacterium]